MRFGSLYATPGTTGSVHSLSPKANKPNPTINITLIISMKNTYVATFPHQKVLLIKPFRYTWTPFGSFYATSHTTGLCAFSLGAVLLPHIYWISLQLHLPSHTDFPGQPALLEVHSRLYLVNLPIIKWHIPLFSNCSTMIRKEWGELINDITFLLQVFRFLYRVPIATSTKADNCVWFL